MDIKEIALKVAEETDAKYPWNMNQDKWIVVFSKALLAEIQKQNEPVGWKYKKHSGGVYVSEHRWDKDQNLYDEELLYTFPPSVEAIENRVAEACAELLKSKHNYEVSAAASHAGNWQPAYEYHMNRQAAVSECANAIRSGEWRKHMKGE